MAGSGFSDDSREGGVTRVSLHFTYRIRLLTLCLPLRKKATRKDHTDCRQETTEFSLISEVCVHTGGTAALFKKECLESLLFDFTLEKQYRVVCTQ